MREQDGFLYILRHPSHAFPSYGLSEGERLYKIGVTTRTVAIRLKQHNTDFKKPAGAVVQETGQLWEVQAVDSVPDVRYAESVFWGHSPLADIPFMGGVEIQPMKPEDVQRAVDPVLRLSGGSEVAS